MCKWKLIGDNSIFEVRAERVCIWQYSACFSLLWNFRDYHNGSCCPSFVACDPDDLLPELHAVDRDIRTSAKRPEPAGDTAHDFSRSSATTTETVTVESSSHRLLSSLPTTSDLRSLTSTGSMNTSVQAAKGNFSKRSIDIGTKYDIKPEDLIGNKVKVDGIVYADCMKGYQGEHITYSCIRCV